MENKIRETLDELEMMLERLKKADNQPTPTKADKKKEKSDKPTAQDAEEAVKRLKKVPFLTQLSPNIR